MDRSLDSIGSCSLDVDADSSDISDTSGSLNFPTPLSVKDITREFTANLRERCILRSPQQLQYTTTAFVDPGTGLVRMVLSPVGVEPANEPNAAGVDVDIDACAEASSIVTATAAAEKKPSYLNLACSVNGYSNLTTYDSKIRQDINKSREVSPIRPSTSSLQYCKRNNSLAAPVLNSMPLITQPCTPSKYSLVEASNNNKGHGPENGADSGIAQCNGSANGSSSGTNGSTSSFIKSRVERLYGANALTQVLYSPKKHGRANSPSSAWTSKYQLEVECPQNSELARKFKQLSPSKDYGEFRKKLHNNCSQAVSPRKIEPLSGKNGEVDLPVFRHLSHEFRAQLPTVSPKRSVPRSLGASEVNLATEESQSAPAPIDVVDHEPVKNAQLDSEQYIGITKIITAPQMEKDGNHFLKILKGEQDRLLALAALAEKYIDALANNPDITEDTFGLLRAASGKARLLASKKMKQFEGLCHNNLNPSPEDAFPTTVDDLQGFWDMVYLQVTQVDSIFADIDQLKMNDWKATAEPPAVETVSKTIKSTKTGLFKAKTAGSTKIASANGSKSAAANSMAALRREAQRKQLLEMKRQRREAMAAVTNSPTACDDGAGQQGEGIGGDSSAFLGVKNSS
ncbi:disks large-associated protein 4 isoform X1 [Drosophila miranda]|uniref:disks large-associated protein 4 isoform X1 n=1 Tax=Drosophila miranda TaxID=7229 RepID=UPI00143F0ECD|nr:disks large-associated protein 4 isoform X1 [Drosophila miranda]